MTMRAQIAALLVATSTPAPVLALDYQLHGFAAQGYIWSDGNDVGGASRGRGDNQYYEIGASGALDLGHGLLISAQEVARRFGDDDEGDVQLDYAQLDWRYWSSQRGHAGARLGKVKIPYGFYNDTRDVVFNRPGILLPDSVYSDSSGQQRDFLFASQGGQLYGDVTWGAHDLSLTAGYMLDQNLREEEMRTLVDLGGLPFTTRITQFWHARAMDEIDGSRWQFALSHLDVRFEVQTTSASPLDVSARADVRTYPLSARYNGESFSVTLEYAPQHTQQWSTVAGTPADDEDWSDGGYLQGEWRFLPGWTALLRFDAQFAERTDRGGDKCVALGLPDYTCYAYTGTAGLNWQPDQHWGVWAEYNAVDGVYNKYSIISNRDHGAAKHWGSALLMAGYRF